MNVNYFLKHPDKPVSSVEAIIRFRGKRYKLSPGISVVTKYWDKKSHRAQSVREYKDSDFINIQLEQFENAASAEFIKATIAGKMPDPGELKQAITEKVKPIAKEPKPDKSAFMAYFTSYYQSAPYSSKTRINYITSEKIMAKYEQHIRRPLSFDDITVTFYRNFRKWLLSLEKPEGGNYSANYFGTVIKHIKTVMREAGPGADALHQNDEYKSRHFIKETEEADTVYLSTAELDKILQIEITAESLKQLEAANKKKYKESRIDELKYARNLFLIGCYTALRISDFSRLDWQNIGEKYIRIKPLKGTRKNEDVVIPIHPVIRQIIDSGFEFTKRRTPHWMNELLKDLAQLAGINEQITTVRTEGGRKITRVTPKYKLISSHTARRSGATNMYIAGIPSISIMKITGHRTERSFLRYIRINQEENARLLAEHPFFKSDAQNITKK